MIETKGFKLVLTSSTKRFQDQVKFGGSYHPETNGQTEKVNQALEDMLRVCVLGFQRKREDYVSLVNFLYNNIYQSTTKIVPFETLYGLYRSITSDSMRSTC